jgi:uncharacterized protein (TIGR03083 family)
MAWGEARDAVLAEAAGLLAVVEAYDDRTWDRATACDGWTAGAVAAHVATAMAAQQQAFRHLLAGNAQTPPYDEVAHESPASTLARLRAATAEVAEVQPQLAEAHVEREVPLPFGTFPMPVALDIVLLEYATHRWDLTSVVDPDATMSDAGADAVLRLLPGFLGLFAAEPPAAPVAYRLEAGATVIEASCASGTWIVAEGVASDADAGVEVATVSGAPGDVALFALGRIPASHPRLSTSGDHAAAFKAHFPGP